jgi:DNA-binding MarR family transcriptional regulator
MVKRKEAASHKTKSPPPAHLTEALNAFRRIMRMMRVAAGETQTRFDVSAAQLYVLDELSASGGPLSIKELADATMTDRSSVAHIVDRLVEKGYVTRGWQAADRRRAEVRITEAGETLARSAPPAPTMRLLSGLRELPKSDIEALAGIMTRLTDELGLSDEPVRLMFDDGSRTQNAVNSRKVALLKTHQRDG